MDTNENSDVIVRKKIREIAADPTLLQHEIGSNRGPLFLDHSGESAVDENIICNAGFGLVDTGERKLLVTCNHVWEEYQNERRHDAKIRLCVCLDRNSPVVLAPSQLIDHNSRLDIATFDMEPILAACDGRRFYPLNRNPAPLVAKGDRLVMLGNPGIFRSGTAEGLEFGVTTYVLHVSSADGFRFHSDISNVEMRNVPPPVRVPASSPHGGISGSPCFLLGQPCRLIGFAVGHWSHYLCFTHARCLNSDGTINH